MAGFSYDQAIANAQPPVFFTKAGTAPKAANVWVDLWGTGGTPTPGAFNTTLNGAVLTNVTQGGLRFVNPTTAAYLLKFQASSSVAGALMLYDRIWHNGGIAITTTTAQAITTPTITRDINNASGVGAGLIVGMGFSAVSTNAAVTNTTLAYTGDDGNTGTATIASYVAAASANTFVPFAFDATKQHAGIRAISGLTLGTSYLTGTAYLAIIRPIAIVNIATAGLVYSVDLPNSGVPQLFTSSVLGMMWMSPTTTAPTITGMFAATQN